MLAVKRALLISLRGNQGRLICIKPIQTTLSSLSTMPRKRSWKARKGRGDNADGGGRGKDSRHHYQLTQKHNPMFEQYYKEQGIVPEGEFEEFMETLKQPLPSTFRITGFRREAQEVLRIMKEEFFPKLVGRELEDGLTLEPPKTLTWYPDELAWQLNLGRNFIRKCEDLNKFHKFLVSETESGNISRQEAVSMIPPLVMDIKPHHKVLDMCAAPGSKTAQLIEMLHKDEDVQIPEGVVVANDADNKRCYLMVHQVKRLQSPCFAIINHDASQLPNMTMDNKEGRKVHLNYDRVLVDVPCSGDGTIRKNFDIWGKWSSASGHSLHGLQRRILLRGIELLAVGGRLVYSTCSLNPIEDEAVISSVLRKCDGALELVDVRDQLPGLKTTPGKSKWRVMERNGDWYDSVEDVPERLKAQMRPSVFPPPPEVAESQNLHRCMRILPHHQNTGGFFVTVIKKVKQVPWFKGEGLGTPDPATKLTSQPSQEEPNSSTAEKEASTADVEMTETEQADVKEVELQPEGAEQKDDGQIKQAANEEDGQNAGEKGNEADAVNEQGKRPAESDETEGRKKRRIYKEDPFVFLEPDDPILDPVRKFFSIDKNFPWDQLLVRTKEGKKRNVYLVSKPVKKLTHYNAHRVKFVNMGLKVLTRSESKYTDCDFRITQEGIQVLNPFCHARRVKVQKDDIITIMSYEYPFLSKMSEPLREQLKALEKESGQGSLIFSYEGDGSPGNPDCPIILCGWLGVTSCRSFVPKMERTHFLRLCGSDIDNFEHSSDRIGLARDNNAPSPDSKDDKKEEKKDDEDEDVKAAGDEVKEGDVAMATTECSLQDAESIATPAMKEEG